MKYEYDDGPRNDDRRTPDSLRFPFLRRCGGFLIKKRCLDLAESVEGYLFWASRCVQCGDLVDEVIRRNRERPPEADEVSEHREEQPIEHAA